MQAVLDAFQRTADALEAGDHIMAEAHLQAARGAFPSVPDSQRAGLIARGRELARRVAMLQASNLDSGYGDDEALAATYAAYEQGEYGYAEPTLADLEVAAPRPAPGIPNPPEPEELLERFGLSAFRPGQRDAVQAALDGRDSLIVFATGSGKSLCYQLPAIASDRLTVVVSPLVALIADQHQRLLAGGHRSVMLAATLGEDHNRQALADIRTGRATIVFCAPERFASAAFRSALSRRAIALFVVDEAHCVAEWGHDFRPDYLRLAQIVDALGRPPIMACTATATPQVAEEIVTRLGLRDPLILRRGFDRPNLSFDVIELEGKGAVARKRALLLEGLADPANRPAVVYCGSRKDTEAVKDLLSSQGINAVAYHAGLEPQTRQRAQEKFMEGAAEVVVATNAFGMGVDKHNIRSVWHWALPTSVEAYYQEAGRAGRDGQPARAVLLAMRGDLGRLIQFIKQSELCVDDVLAVVEQLRRLADPEGVVLVDAASQDDRQRIAVSIAERAGGLTLAPAGGGRLAIRLADRPDRRAVAALCREAVGRRWDAYQALRAFTDSQVCRRRQLLDHFGDDEPMAPQGRCCDVCDPLDWLDLSVDSAAVLPSVSKKASRRAGSRPRTETPVDGDAMERLKAWRMERAEGKPAYTVTTNAALEEVLRQRPRDRSGLLAIKGIGEAFVAKHGQSLLDLLQTL